jgi:hypothetical protein
MRLRACQLPPLKWRFDRMGRHRSSIAVVMRPMKASAPSWGWKFGSGTSEPPTKARWSVFAGSREQTDCLHHALEPDLPGQEVSMQGGERRAAQVQPPMEVAIERAILLHHLVEGRVECRGVGDNL